MHDTYLYIPYFQVKPRKHVSRDMQKIRDKRKKDAGGIFLGERKSCNIYLSINFLTKNIALRLINFECSN